MAGAMRPEPQPAASSGITDRKDGFPVQFQLLGPVRAETAGGPVPMVGATTKAVLAALLLRGEAGASTDEVIAMVWGEPGSATRDSVYHYISILRKMLAPTGAVLQTRQPRYRLAVDAESVDWHRFQRLVREARAAREREMLDQAAILLRLALALWHGPPLADVGDRMRAYRHEMAERRRVAIELLAEVEAVRGNYHEVLTLLRAELSAKPVHERAAVLTIDALTALGQRGDAGEVYRLTRTRLRDEQGLDPGEQLEAAHRRALEGAAPDLATTFTPISGLPRLDPIFTDRDCELQTVTAALRQHGGAQLCVIYGMAGCGKTALAVRAAHALAESFADGVIFLDLHGYTEDRAALTAAEAIDRLLRRMRIDGAMIPADYDERAAIYQDVLASRRVLLVLDDARDATQVRRLLPAAAGCAAIVTSRRHLAALDESLALPLGTLGQQEAVQLFRLVAGHDRVRNEPTADSSLSRVTNLCGRLPLAIRVAAGRYRARARQSLADLEARLSDADSLLTELDDDDRSVAASFRVSLLDLPSTLARTFALLAMSPGSDFDALAVAALADTTPGEAIGHLTRLADRHLITEHALGRFRFHDLIKVFTRKYVLESVPVGEAVAALWRLADYYLRTAETADSLITPYRYRVPITTLDRAASLPPLDDYDAAFTWLSTEQSNLVYTCIAAGDGGLDAVCWQLAYTLRGYFFVTKNWQSWTATHETALVAAHRCGDARAEAMIVNNLGLAYLEQGASDRAADCYRRARRLFGAASDPHGEHTAQANLAWLLFSKGQFAEFIARMRPVLKFYRDNGAERNAAITLRGVGLAEAALGLIAESITDLCQARDVFLRLELRLDTAMTWNALGETYQKAGDSQSAATAFAEALTTARQSGSEYEQARAHHRLAEVAVTAGDRLSAREHWTQALERYQRLGARQRAEVQREIDDLDRYS